MRQMVLPLAAVLAICASSIAVAATLQDPAAATSVAAELSEEDRNAAPFPAGPNAALVKKVCVDCHDAARVLDLRYTKEEAESFYRSMVSSDISTDQAQKIITYLTTFLAP